MLIYFHIPKCGGTTMLRWFERLGLKIERGSSGLTEEAVKAQEIGADVLIGHVPYAGGYPTEMVTASMFRNPVEHALSAWFYGKSRWEKRTLQPFPLTIYQSFDRPREEINVLYKGLRQDNIQSRMINADNLPKLTWIGILEEWDSSVDRMATLINAEECLFAKYARYRMTHSFRPTAKHLPSGLLQRIEKNNEEDMDLYSYARRLFKERSW